MNKGWKDVATAVVMGMIVPYLLMNLAWRWGSTGALVPQIKEDTGETLQDTMTVSIRVRMDDTIEVMDLERYLVGVVLGEMPASFEIEALKAQAVVARTYTLRRWELGSKHSDADICTDPACCQAYRDPVQYDGGEEQLEKVYTAVRDTGGLVLTYDGRLIEATYFSSSGGRTEDAMAVWGNDLPYLRATDSPEDAYSEQYLHTQSFTTTSFQAALGQVFSGDCRSWFGPVTYTDGGGVDTMVIGDKEYSGVELRRLLGLRSTAFTLSVANNTIIITTRGYGHRVGMSQYGAEAMAVEGSTFEDILAHYYRGTVLEEYIDIGSDIG